MFGEVTRSTPRRPAWMYPIGTVITLRDGRTFEVVERETEPYMSDVDRSDGNYYTTMYKAWQPTDRPRRRGACDEDHTG